MRFVTICEEMIQQAQITGGLSPGDCLDLAAVIISVAAMLISVFALWQNRQINTTNLQAVYFEKIFSTYCIKEIPKKVSKLRFVDGRLDRSYQGLVNTMMDMIRDCKYFQYAKNTFYRELEGKTIELEDKLLNEAGALVDSEEEQNEFFDSVDEDVREILKLINKNYHKF